jgi:hypothetical protein
MPVKAGIHCCSDDEHQFVMPNPLDDALMATATAEPDDHIRIIST